MTIYKKPYTEKVTNKSTNLLSEPLTSSQDAEVGDSVRKVVRVVYFPSSRKVWISLCLIFTALLVLAMGTVATIFLYYHLSDQVVRRRCGVTYYEETDGGLTETAQSLFQAEEGIFSNGHFKGLNMKFFEEDIEVSEEDDYERLLVPEFDDTAETVVWHDFVKNITAIVDKNQHVCYIMALNRTRIAPPHDLIDLIDKLMSRYYMPKVSVVRDQYRIMWPPLSTIDLLDLGNSIMQECYFCDTYKLKKSTTGIGVAKRSVQEIVPSFKKYHYGYYSLQMEPANSHVYKMTIEMDDNSTVSIH